VKEKKTKTGYKPLIPGLSKKDGGLDDDSTDLRDKSKVGSKSKKDKKKNGIEI
jgi:hypothetical protein